MLNVQNEMSNTTFRKAYFQVEVLCKSSLTVINIRMPHSVISSVLSSPIFQSNSKNVDVFSKEYLY